MEPLFKVHTDRLWYCMSWELHSALASFKMFRAWACEMVQPVKMLATESDDLRSILGATCSQGEDDS